MGPLIHLSMLRWEAKHQQLKKSLAGNMNFRNINKTIINKHQKAESIAHNRYKDDIETGSKKRVVDHSIFFEQNVMDIGIEIFETNFLRINNTEFTPKLLFIYESALFQVRRIFTQEQKYYLLGQKFEVVGFDSFLNCLEIECNDTEAPIFVDLHKLSKVKTYEIKRAGYKQFILNAIVSLEKTNFWM